MENSDTNQITVGQAKKMFPVLSGLLEHLTDETPLNMSTLSDLYAPGNPLDRLGAMYIIINYLVSVQK